MRKHIHIAQDVSMKMRSFDSYTLITDHNYDTERFVLYLFLYISIFSILPLSNSLLSFIRSFEVEGNNIVVYAGAFKCKIYINNKKTDTYLRLTRVEHPLLKGILPSGRKIYANVTFRDVDIVLGDMVG